jgi:hypothetical protein
MKKTKLYVLMLMVALGSFSVANASDKPAKPTPTEIPAEIVPLLNRLDEIKAMDKSELTRLERKALRVEVREIKSAVRASGNGIYISSGAIIIILLLIIIL